METIRVEMQNQNKLMELCKSKSVLPKKEWPPEAILNSAIVKCVMDNDKGYPVYLALTDDKYVNALSKFLSKVQDNDIHFGLVNAAVNYEQIIFVPEDTSERMLKLPIFGDVVQIKNDDFNLILVPYGKGIMIHGINVNPKLRNKGLGSKLINILYDVSEELDIPLFLTPYPDDDNVPKNQIWNVIHRLRNYYDRLGFGPLKGMQLLWSNYEDKYVDEIVM